MIRPDWVLNPGPVGHCSQAACTMALPLAGYDGHQTTRRFLYGVIPAAIASDKGGNLDFVAIDPHVSYWCHRNGLLAEIVSVRWKTFSWLYRSTY